MKGPLAVEQKPTIKVYYQENRVSKKEFCFLLYGMEEEGIPYEIHPVNEQNVLDISHSAAKDSKLGVGFGINSMEVVLHYEKLDRLSPIFRVDLQSNQQLLRALGANAARLVKRMPFKNMNDFP
ncbi:MAG: glycerol dehydratase [Tissierella sp.]|nr:glycerol dehydratase [Tissierella sp.]